MKGTILAVLGIVGSFLARQLGGWDTALQILVIIMSIDYLTGLIVAGVFKKSDKSETGALDSKAGWKGLCKKGVTLLVVLIASQIDKVTGTEIVRNATVIWYIGNEGISIVENAGLMGVPIPKFVRDALEILKRKQESPENDDTDGDDK